MRRFVGRHEIILLCMLLHVLEHRIEHVAVVIRGLERLPLPLTHASGLLMAVLESLSPFLPSPKHHHCEGSKAGAPIKEARDQVRVSDKSHELRENCQLIFTKSRAGNNSLRDLFGRRNLPLFMTFVRYSYHTKAKSTNPFRWASMSIECAL